MSKPETMMIDDVKYVREDSIDTTEPVILSIDTAPWQLGKIYLIRTVTMTDTGRLVAVTQQELVLEDAAWIADTGRFAQAVEKAEFGEVEPFPSGKVIIGRGAVIDAVEIKKVQRSQK
jgi:hypothetical protein